ncbi:MAG TPA: hypothetical protein VGR48_17570 [Terriglobales bacterium]|nr:hypothetical protein [Terriglobales bacterium]
MENYFNYFTEIEEHFHRRRGSTLLLSTLDWALIETWKDAGIPLEAVLRGIDATFDRYENRPSRPRKINGLAYCSQEVLAAAEEMKEAAVGARREPGEAPGLNAAEIGAFLDRNADILEGLASVRNSLAGQAPDSRNSGAVKPLPPSAHTIVKDAARTLRDLAGALQTVKPVWEDLERRLTVMEEKLFAVLLAATPDDELVSVRAQADRELAPYRRKMPAAQIEQLHKQFVHKRLMEEYAVPRLSLFYM